MDGMKSEKIISVFLKIIPACTIVLFFIFNLLTPLIADDFAYSFIIGGGERISSLKDILASQVNHYYLVGGRNLADGCEQFFLMFNKIYFDVANALVYAALILLIQFHSLDTLKAHPIWFLIINVLLWIFVPNWGQNFLWLGGSINYLWTAVTVLIFLVPFKKKILDSQFSMNIPLSLLFFFWGIISGWSHENTAAAIFFILIAYFVNKYKNKQRIDLFEITGTIGFIIGFGILLSAPGNWIRVKVGDSFINYPFYFRLLIRLAVTSAKYFSYCFFLTGISVFLYLRFIYKKIKINSFVYLYFIGAIMGTYSMLAAPGWDLRAILITIIFLCISLLNLLNVILQYKKEHQIYKILIRYKAPILVICFFTFIGSVLTAGRNMTSLFLARSKENEQIMEQKEKGILDIVITSEPVRAHDNHTAQWGVNEFVSITEVGNSITAYYGVNSITRNVGGVVPDGL